MTKGKDKAMLLELAERCEKATGPNGVLDDDIARTIHALDGRMWSGLSQDYTASLDAALSLAGELGGQVTFYKDGTGKAFVWQPYPLAVEAKAATPALALCTVILRAKAAAQ